MTKDDARFRAEWFAFARSNEEVRSHVIGFLPPDGGKVIFERKDFVKAGWYGNMDWETGKKTLAQLHESLVLVPTLDGAETYRKR